MWLFLANPLYLHNSCRICSHYLHPTSSMKAVEVWAVMHSCIHSFIHLWGNITDSSRYWPLTRGCLGSASWMWGLVKMCHHAQVKFCFSVLFLKRIISEVGEMWAWLLFRVPCFGSQHPHDTLDNFLSHTRAPHTCWVCVCAGKTLRHI